MLGIVIVGLTTGGVYALSALGLVSIFRGSKVLNFALGAFAAWGGYLFAHLRDDSQWSTVAALAVVVGAAAVAGAAIYMLVIRPIRRRSEMQKIVMTLGISAAMTGALVLVFGEQIKSVDPIFPKNDIVLFGTHVGLDQILVVATALALAGVLALWSSHGRLALATRALDDNEAGVEMLGYSPHLLGALNWALGSVLAAIAGVLLAPIIGLTPTSLGAVIAPALAAAVIGRFESYGWAVVGGLVLGVAQSLVTRYTGGGWASLVPLAMVMAALLARRDGATNRPTVTSTLRVSRELPAANVLFLGLFAFMLLSGNAASAQAAVVSMCFAILALSVVVITGYGNQISLAQMAIAGLAGLICAHLYLDFSVPFILLPPIGALIGVVLGVSIGIPALRLSGVNLAVVTITASIAVESLVFNSFEHWITGGSSGLILPSLTIFGADVTALTHPAAYGFVVLVWLTIAAGVVVALRRSRFGRTLMAVRSNERVAAATGINVARTKTLTFAISAALAGLAGVLLVFMNSTVILSTGWAYTDSVALLVVAILAGATSVRGGVLAGVLATSGIVFVWVTDVSWISEHYLLISAVGLILTVIGHPHGISFMRQRRGSARQLPDTAQQTRAAGSLALSDVSVSFGGVNAVSEVSLPIPRGEIVGVIGPNGAGKTTLLDAVCGYVQASGGISLDHAEISKLPTYRRARAGVARVFQGVELFEELTVGQNLRMPIDAGVIAAATPPAAAAWIAATGLEDKLALSPAELSLGARKLVGVARALMADPALLLLDEPGAGMGHGERDELAAAVRMLSRGHGLSIVLIDHDMPLISAVCDTVYVLVGGSVLTSGTPSGVFGDERVRRAYLGSDGAQADNEALDIAEHPVLTARTVKG
jgi:branched-subunit amino acid ABC-type transport system permease component/ABC-type branched-subunit amino acid transport system ATPase component